MSDTVSDLIGRALELADLVNYQAGSVVSRTIIDKPVGTVTLFSFDKGQGLSEHTAPYDALVYLVEGEAKITIAGEPHQVSRGQILILPANRPHLLRADQRFKMLLVMVRA